MQFGTGEIGQGHLVIERPTRLFSDGSQKLVKGQWIHEQILHPAYGEADLPGADQSFEQRAGADDVEVRCLFVKVAQGSHRFGYLLDLVEEKQGAPGGRRGIFQEEDGLNEFGDGAGSPEEFGVFGLFL